MRARWANNTQAGGLTYLLQRAEETERDTERHIGRKRGEEETERERERERERNENVFFLNSNLDPVAHWITSYISGTSLKLYYSQL